MTVERGVAGPNTSARRPRNRQAHRAAWGLAAAVLLLAAFVVATGWTGFPGPGPLRRYPTSDLQALADRINDRDCSRGPGQGSGPPVATVDWLRSRVHLSLPWMVTLTAEDRPLVGNPSDDGFSTGPATLVRCVGFTGPG